MELQGTFQNGMPFVSIRVGGKEFSALMDTGYDGYVMLSGSEINRLNLKELGKTVYRTADGELHEGRIFQGRIEWFGTIKEVAIDSTDGDFALIGMKLLNSHRVLMEPANKVLLLSPLHLN